MKCLGTVIGNEARQSGVGFGRLHRVILKRLGRGCEPACTRATTGGVSLFLQTGTFWNLCH